MKTYPCHSALKSSKMSHFHVHFYQFWEFGTKIQIFNKSKDFFFRQIEGRFAMLSQNVNKLSRFFSSFVILSVFLLNSYTKLVEAPCTFLARTFKLTHLKAG